VKITELFAVALINVKFRLITVFDST